MAIAATESPNLLSISPSVAFRLLETDLQLHGIAAGAKISHLPLSVFDVLPMLHHVCPKWTEVAASAIMDSLPFSSLPISRVISVVGLLKSGKNY